ncbi:pilus assembly protein TadG-related protein [Paeniglutamicibacter sp. NPDC091659]|uniref:pilus assembly protein TadG-related protein n=1 Tax=Paeniglutamicibacter sp. NPDC091659 TaxID=3364389 RepID=UPI003813A6E5
MWRVIKNSRPPLRSSEQGASSIIVAIMMVVLLGFAAISIDVGKLYWEKAQLQNGADAGALALASICGKNEADPQCTGVSSIAPQLANKNANDASSLVPAVLLDKAGNKVTVETAAAETGSPANTVSTWFARILDPKFSSVEVGARATAVWGPPGKLSTKFPLAFSQCEIDSSPTFDGQLQFLMSHGVGDTTASDACHSTSSGHEIPGGFGWLTQEPAASCSLDTFIGGWELTDTGNNFKAGCEVVLAEWKAALKAGEQVIVLLPVFDDVKGTGAGGQFKIHAYAAIDIRGWHFKNGDDLLDFQLPEAAKVIKDGGYKNSDLGFVGKFIRYVFDDEDAEYGGGGKDYGAGIIQLVD